VAYIPKGKYLTVEQYAKKVGFTRQAVLTAIRNNRLKGVINLDSRTYLVPENAIMIYNNIKTGKYIGVSAWLRGEIQHQEELKDWNRKQEILRQMREKDLQ